MIDVTNEVLYNGIDEPEYKSKEYGKSLEKLGEEYERLISLTADMTSVLEVDRFRDKFPERTYSMGMAEQNMIGVAAGLAAAGEIPFAHTFACFITRRTLDQIVNAVAYPNANVKIIGMMPGISSPGGASHQAIDDLAFMRAVPNMNILDLGDSTDVSMAAKVALETDGPMYIRIRRGVLPELFDSNNYELKIGQSYLLKKGNDIGIITSGLMTERALTVASIIENQGISASVLHVPSIKPLDVEGVTTIASEHRAIVTLDNHNVIGGLGSAVSEVIAENQISVPFKRIGLQDRFGKAGSMQYLSRIHGMETDQIAQTAASLIGEEIKVYQEDKETLKQGAGWGEDWKN